MGTTADKLLQLQNTKESIKNAIIAKGTEITNDTPFKDYSMKIMEIKTSDEPEDWIKPTEWLELPDNIDGIEKISILNAVFDTDSEYIAMIFEGNYTVDWGDGIIENFASGVKAEHKYTYSNPNLNSGTVDAFNYKQCIITITPQAGSNLTLINFNINHSLNVGNTNYSILSGFLDLRINAPYCTLVTLAMGPARRGYVVFNLLERCIIGELNVSTLEYLFAYCYSLQVSEIKTLENITNFNNMHAENSSLRKLPNYKFGKDPSDYYQMFSNCTGLSGAVKIDSLSPSSLGNGAKGMFQNCRKIESFDITFDINNDFSFNSMFQNCSAAKKYDFNFIGSGRVNNLSSAFSGNYCLLEAPALETNRCTTFYSTFSQCFNLINLQEYDYSEATTLAAYLNGCCSIVDAGFFNTSSALTTLQTSFNGCKSLKRPPRFEDTSGVKNVQNMLSDCHNLLFISDYSFPSCSNAQYFAARCYSLQFFKNVTFGVSTPSSNYNSVITASTSLKKIIAPFSGSFSVAGFKMSASALDEMYTALPTVSGQIIGITSTPGASGDNPTIATAKGWTVSG